MPDQKKCIGPCAKWYPISETYFFRRTAHDDGFQNICKTCRKATRADRQGDKLSKRDNADPMATGKYTELAEELFKDAPPNDPNDTESPFSLVSDADPFMRPASSLPQVPKTRREVPISQRATKKEVLKLIKEIEDFVANAETTLAGKLQHLLDIEAWVPLGFKDWQEMGKSVFKKSGSQVRRVMQEVVVARDLAHICAEFPEAKGLSGNALREIGKVEILLPDDTVDKEATAQERQKAASILIERARGTRYQKPELRRFNGVPTAAMAAKVVNIIKAGGDVSNMDDDCPPMPTDEPLPGSVVVPHMTPFEENEDEDQITEADVAAFEPQEEPNASQQEKDEAVVAMLFFDRSEALGLATTWVDENYIDASEETRAVVIFRLREVIKWIEEGT